MANHKVGQMTIAGVVLGVMGSSLFSSGVWVKSSWGQAAMMGSGVFFMFISVLYFYWSALDPARSHSLTSQWADFLRHLYLATGARLGYAMLKSAASDVTDAQLSVLQKILKVNAHCEYGREQFSGVEDVATFRGRVPVTTYADVRPLIEGAMKGYQSLGTADRVVEVVREAGEDGERHFAVTDTLKLDVKSVNVLLDFQRRRMRKHNQLRSVLVDIRCEGDVTEGGLPVKDMDSFLTSYMSASLLPSECYALPPEAQYYAHALIVLAENQVKAFEFSSIEVMENFFKVILEHQVQLAFDMRRCHVNAEMGFSERMRSLIDGRLIPSKGRHLALKRALETGEEHLALKLWMDLKYVTVRGGIWRQPSDLVMAAMADLRWERNAHITAEGILGFSVNANTPPQYVFAFSTTFFEFIEVGNEAGEGEPIKTLLLHEITEGNKYEVVMTTNSGLYRYRTGKFIEVTGRWKDCPIYKRKD